MKGKILFVAGGVIGYVLGARAGRKRYEQIKQAANRVWENPSVQKQVHQVEDFASQKLGDVPEMLADVTKKVVSGAVDKMTSRGNGSSGSTSKSGGGNSMSGKSGSSSGSGASSKSSGRPHSRGSGMNVDTEDAEAAVAADAAHSNDDDTTVDEARANAARPPRSTSKDESL